MSNATCAIKNRTNEEMAARREYGVPVRRGMNCCVDGIMEYNTIRSDYCNFINFDIEEQKRLFKKNITDNASSLNYISFLQDYFYRKFKGYVLPYFELPLGNPKRMELYNQTALDSGHPEYMVDSKGNPLKIGNDSKPVKTDLVIEDTKSKKENKPVDSGAVDVLDSEGNVVAENVGSLQDVKQQLEKSKEKLEGMIEKKSAKEQKSTKGQKPNTKQEDQTIKLDAVRFNPGKIDIDGVSHEKDDPDRKDDYKKHNQDFLSKYSDDAKAEMQKFLSICESENRVVRLDNLHGLILATVYTKGIPEAIDRTVMRKAIDPAKIRNEFSVLTEDPDRLDDINPFSVVGVPFDDPGLKFYLFGALKPEDEARLVEMSNQGSGFYRYISYNAFTNDEIKFAIANTYYLCERLQQLGMNVRFKVLNKESVNNFDLTITKNVGLGYYAKDNKKFEGLTVHVQLAEDGYVYLTASGDHAGEFASAVSCPTCPIYYMPLDNVNGMVDSLANAAEQVKQEAATKANAKKINPAKKGKKQTVEIPAGRK